MTAPTGASPGDRGFTLDRFQLEGIAAIDAGRSVLVSAPTGSGKTVVAEYAVATALRSGRRAFYTTPIKALSNQKYGDLVREHGADQVGLLTGDNAINGDAPIVVMTTEVLRNMIYARSSALDALDWVVLDEVHYLQDAYRGPVWEEVLVHAPRQVRFVCLSATVSNAEELAGWIDTIRGPVSTVVEHRRPVELVNHFLVHDKLERQQVMVPTLVGGRPNPDGHRFDAADLGQPKNLRPRGRPRRRWATPRRAEVVDQLREDQLLPAIYFIFSRAGCDDAARAALADGARLTTAEERERIRAVAERHVEHLTDQDLDTLGWDTFLAGLEAGVAAHHAGMVPPFKEIVEACFAAGLVKVVFATETLALGINMPARSVVIESLSKFTGERHEDLTPAQYTQLTGRAGRRGLDPVGHAVVLWSPWYGFDRVAALAASRDFVLRSAFRPTYNMAANLVRRYDREEAHRLLDQSFAQYQADRSVVKVEARRHSRAEALEVLEADARCERGDVDEYRELVRADREAASGQRARTDVEQAIARLAPGDVVRLGGRRLAVLTVAQRKGGGGKVRLVDTEGKAVMLGVDDFDEPPERVAALTLPQPFEPRSSKFRHRTAEILRRTRVGHGSDRRRRGPGRAVAQAPHHPVAGCPDRDRHLRAAIGIERIHRELADLDRTVAERTATLGRRFDAILDLLGRWGHLDGWALTERGEMLARLYHESDLLVVEALAEGLLDDLDAPTLAGVASLLTYEHRSKTPPPTPWYPNAEVRAKATAIDQLARRLVRDEERAGLPASRLPDPTFLPLAHAWAAGEGFDTVIEAAELSGGDFVRNVKQLIDLLRQLGEVAPVAATRASARAAAEALFRGIVATSSSVGTGVDDDEPVDDALADDRPGNGAGEDDRDDEVAAIAAVEVVEVVDAVDAEPAGGDSRGEGPGSGPG
ncbi:MAG: superfamily helicase [Acidimicrobiales bacterium]|nr:superfamily helicase [Acidimicrobiales bacterium]